MIQTKNEAQRREKLLMFWRNHQKKIVRSKGSKTPLNIHNGKLWLGFSFPPITKIWIKPRGGPCRPIISPPFGACSFLPMTTASHVQTPCNLRPWLTIVTFNSIFVFVCLFHMTSGGASIREGVKFGRHTFLGHICRQKQTQPEAKGLECQEQSIGKRKAWGVGTHSPLDGKEDRFRLPGSFPIANNILPR